MYVVKRKSVELKGSLWIILGAAIIAMLLIIGFSPRIYAQSVDQVHLQQESVTQFYEETFPDGPSMIIPSASDAVNVSVTVLDNLSLSVTDGQPKYATNWKYGATLHEESEGDSVLIWTVAANY